MVRFRRIAVLSACWWLGACAVSTPFRWQEVAADTSVEISLTYARLDPENREAFDNYTDQIRQVIGEQPGLIGHSVRRELFGDQVWTYTVWASAGDRQAFVRSDLHRRAIENAAGAIVDMRVRRFAVRRDEAPESWSEVLQWWDRPAP